MKLAVAFDLPTSYNYVVKFTNDNINYDQITSNFTSIPDDYVLQPYGNVVIDLLKSNEKLIELNDIQSSNKDKFNSDDVETWINNIKSKMFHLPFERDTKLDYKYIYSRLIKSSLFRELLCDADFTGRNIGLVYNKEINMLRYAPNYDYGESFNSLISAKHVNTKIYNRQNTNELEKKDLERLLNICPNYLKAQQKHTNTSVEELAVQFSCIDSEKNLDFIFTNYLEDFKEFFGNLRNFVCENKLAEIMSQYVGCEDFISKADLDVFTRFIDKRCVWYLKYLENKLINIKE